MKHFRLLAPLLALAAILPTTCTRDHDATGPAGKHPPVPQLTVDAAREFFESTASTRTRTEIEDFMPFTLGDPTLHWDDAAASATAAISTVDIPVSGEKTYWVVRQDRHGREYGVMSHAKLIVAKSHTTGDMATYIRVCIPDEMYDGFYDGNICDMTLNCDDRVDYCGLEYYATIDGRPVAVALYDRGRLVDNVFIADSRMTPEQRLQRFSAMMGGTWIIPATDGTTRAQQTEWKYGALGSTFWGNDGKLYIYVDTNNDGIADAVTLYAYYLEMQGFNADNGAGGGLTSGSGDGNTGSPGGTPGGDSPGDSGNSGGLGSGGSGNGNSNNNNNNDKQDKDDKEEKEEKDDEDEQNKDKPVRPIYPGVIRNPNFELVNPIPGYTPIACPKCGQCPCVCPKSIDCDKLYPNFYADKVAADLNYQAFDCKMSEFLNAINNSNYEYNMTLSEKDGAWSVDGPTTSYDENKVYAEIDNHSVASMHNHPSGNPPSETDLWTLICASNEISQTYTDVYIYSPSGEVYVLHVSDSAQTFIFYTTVLNTGGIIPETGVIDHMRSSHFIQFHNCFANAYKTMKGENYNYSIKDAAFYAWQYALEQYNTGIRLMKKEADSDSFKGAATTGNGGTADKPDSYETKKCQ